MPVARAVHAWLIRMRTPVYAWLETVRFRTGVMVLAGLVALAACATAIAVIVAPGRSPAAVHQPLAGQARPAGPPSLPMRSPRLAARPLQPRRAVPAARRASSASRTAEKTANTTYSLASSGRRHGHMERWGQRATDRWDHLTGRGWRHPGHSPRHGHGGWRHGHGRWHDGGGSYHLGRHHLGDGPR